MTQRGPGRPKAHGPLEWRRTVSLTTAEGDWLEQVARERDIPMAILLRHIIREYEERNGDGREGHNLRAL